MLDRRPGRVRVAVLISGAGSNMAALIDAGQKADAPFEVVLVVANRPHAGGLAIAKAKSIAVHAVDHQLFGPDRAAHEREIQSLLDQHAIQLVALAGYMRVLTPGFVQAWRGRMINIHPSLLPLYPGLDTHARAIAAGDTQGGCTVHQVTEGVDEGEILGQSAVPILPDDTPDSLGQRVLEAEHRLYPDVLSELCRTMI
jgi:formyltetrahydrofolate-dependent phosphoribosylglycinamide formyltransferase